MQKLSFLVEKAEPDGIGVRHRPTHTRFSFGIEGRRLGCTVSSHEADLPSLTLRDAARAFATKEARARGIDRLNLQRVGCTDWLARSLETAAAAVTQWFVPKDAPNFGVVAVLISLAVLAPVVGVVALWPRHP